MLISAAGYTFLSVFPVSVSLLTSNLTSKSCSFFSSKASPAIKTSLPALLGAHFCEARDALNVNHELVLL